jgi:hypothetical protein
MNFSIDDNNIEQSFDSIAKELLTGHILRVNEHEFEFTEIEFYYYKKGVHEDSYSHKHLRKAGEWRSHSQGLDITLEGNGDQNGGILIRGLKQNDTFVNGPLKAMRLIFESMGSATDTSTIALIKKELGDKPIIKTFRHIPNKIQDKIFHFKKYRYLTDFEQVDISIPIKNQIVSNYQELR